MTVTFCGHSDKYYGEDVRKRLHDTVEELIKEGAKEFLLGGYGSFDCMAAGVVRNLQQKYPNIRSTLVIPYLDRKYDILDYYDASIYPPIEKAPKRLAIIKRNEWMVDISDVLVAYVDHDWGGAARTYAYAVRRKKIIINLTGV